MQVRHTADRDGLEQVHTFEVLGEDGYKPVEQVYGDGDAISFLKSRQDGFGFTQEAAERVVAFEAKQAGIKNG